MRTAEKNETSTETEMTLVQKGEISDETKKKWDYNLDRDVDGTETSTELKMSPALRQKQNCHWDKMRLPQKKKAKQKWEKETKWDKN